MNDAVLSAQREHLARLPNAIQRGVVLLQASCAKVRWPLTAQELQGRRHDADFYETLAAVNERFTVDYCRQRLKVDPARGDFQRPFSALLRDLASHPGSDA